MGSDCLLLRLTVRFPEATVTGTRTSSGMAERTQEAAPGASPLGHRLLYPPHDRPPACLQTCWLAAQPEGGRGSAGQLAPSAAIAHRHSGSCSFSSHSLRVANWKGNYDVQITSASLAGFLRPRDALEAVLDQDGTISCNA